MYRTADFESAGNYSMYAGKRYDRPFRELIKTLQVMDKNMFCKK